MDTLTHGLIGVALAALPAPRALRSEPAPPRAAVLVSVLAAELPDLDYLLPAEDSVLHTLSAHRGYSHSLLAAPLVAAVATLLTRLCFRGVPSAALYWRALLAVLVGHLLPDLWTGWGTRLLLPFSDQRLALDWTMVLDPWFTLPLLLAAVWAALRPRQLKRALGLGATVATLYLTFRVSLSAHLHQRVAEQYPAADSVHVFPAALAVWRWRYVAVLGERYAAGTVAPGAPAREEARHRAQPSGALPERLRQVRTVREALDWARFPIVKAAPLPERGWRVTIADLRYHLAGSPTLTFVVEVDQAGQVREARLDRGGSARELLRRLRATSEE